MMSKKKTYYITTTAPYVNATPHIGFALEILAADVLARFHRLLGDDVILGTGSDEHGMKIFENATAAGVDPQDYVDTNVSAFVELQDLLHLSVDRFQRTTNPDHIRAAQHFWRLCDESGDIYKKMYEVKYCVGCEMEKTDSELIDGMCPLHPGKSLQLIEEENYFFRFSAYQQRLLELYDTRDDFVLPEEKLNEIRSFVAHGLSDFSISRLKEKMPWGVPVPGDDEHVMYVWFDALVFYISTLGWPDDVTDFSTFWPGFQIAGKDNLRQQSAMWQAMLLSADLAPSRQILINGFISVEGQKMSKSVGNVISPEAMVRRYGAEAARYLIIKLGPVSGDMDVSMDQFDTTYTADLANSLGNTVSRVAALCARSELRFAKDTPPGFRAEVKSPLKEYAFVEALQGIWDSIALAEKKIDISKPWTLEGAELKAVLMELVAHLRQVGYELQPFMPATGQRILEIFKGPVIATPKPLFPRLN